jgi:predicted metal-binding protein
MFGFTIISNEKLNQLRRKYREGLERLDTCHRTIAALRRDNTNLEARLKYQKWAHNILKEKVTFEEHFAVCQDTGSCNTCSHEYSRCRKITVGKSHVCIIPKKITVGESHVCIIPKKVSL